MKGGKTFLPRIVTFLPCFPAVLACLLAGPVQAGALPRVVSLNLCLDQLVLELAKPEQILGLSRFARDARLSHAAEAAKAFPLIKGAEEILFLKPDLVLTSRFTPAATRRFLSAAQVKTEDFEGATSLAETRAQITRMGVLLDNPAGAAEKITLLDAAAARLKGAAQGKLRVLVLARRGYVSGRSSLPGELLTLAGVENAATLGSRGGFTSLEGIIALKPDALLLTGETLHAEDQGSAMLEHPALAALFPPARRLYLPDHLTVCGGPMLAEAMDRLAIALKNITPRVP